MAAIRTPSISFRVLAIVPDTRFDLSSHPDSCPLLFYAQQPKPTEILPAMSETVPAMTPQSVKQSCIALSCLPNINGTPPFVVEDVDSNLLTEVDDAMAAPSMQPSLFGL